MQKLLVGVDLLLLLQKRTLLRLQEARELVPQVVRQRLQPLEVLPPPKVPLPPLANSRVSGQRGPRRPLPKVAGGLAPSDGDGWVFGGRSHLGSDPMTLSIGTICATGLRLKPRTYI